MSTSYRSRRVVFVAWLGFLFCLLHSPAGAQAKEPAASYVETIRLYNQGNFEEALPRLHSHLDSVVNDVLLERTARAYRHLGQEAEGEEYFRSWAAGGSLPPPLSYAIALLRGSAPDAFPYYHSAIRRCPNNCRYIKKLFDESLRIDSLGAAHRFLETLPNGPGRRFGEGYYARKTGKLEQAVTLLEEAYRMGADTLETLGSLGACAFYLGRYEESVQWYRIGSDFLNRQGDWENDALFVGSLANAYMKLERYEESLPVFERAIRLMHATGLGWHEVSHLAGAGDAARLLANYDLADQLLSRAVGLSRSIGDPSSELRALTSWAASLIAQGRSGEAIEVLDDAVERGTMRGGEVHLRAMVTLGNAYCQTRDFARSESIYRDLLVKAEEAGDLRSQAYAWSGLGRVAQETGRLSEAERSVRRAIELSIEAGDRPGERRRKSFLGLVYELQGRYQEALDLYVANLPLDRESGDRQAIAVGLSNISNVYDYLGDYSQALRFREEALDSTRAMGDRKGEAMELANLGLLQMRVKSYGPAKENFEKAFELSKELEDEVTQSHLLIYLGQLHVDTGEPAGALPYLEEAYKTSERVGNHYAAIDALLMKGRALFELGDTGVSSSVHQDALRMAREMGSRYHEWLAEFRLGQVAHREGEVDRALTHYERSIKTSSLSRQDLRDDRNRITFQESKTRVFGAAVRLLAAHGRAEEAFLYAERGKARALLDLLSTDPQTDSTALREEAVSLAETQRLITSSNTLFLNYWLGDSTSQLWVIRDKGWSHHPLPPRGKIEESVRFLRAKLEGGDEWGRASRALGEMLLGPLSAEVGEGSSLVIAPDGILHYLPFEALSLEGTAVVQAASIRYVPSATVLRELGGRPSGRSWNLHFMGLGNPAPTGGTGLDPLPFAAREVEDIAKLFPKGTARVLKGHAATERAAIGNDARSARYLHLASHARIDPDRPLRSSILLAADSGGASDGRLVAADVGDLKFQCELVVLSGCETGIGREARGEGVVGFSRLFLAAGAEGLVVSLWKVNDISTATLMRRFYENLQRGENPARALQQAKGTFLSGHDARLRHPYYWAPFVLIGCPSWPDS